MSVLLLGMVGCGSKAKKGQETTSQFAAAKKAYDEGNFAQAESTLAGTLQKSPDDVKTLELMALAEAAQGKNKEAIAQYQKIVTAQPKDHASWYRMALLERISGDAKNSEAHLEKALSINPGDRGYTDELARTKMSLGEYEAAASLWGSLLHAGTSDKEGRKELFLLQGQAYQAAKEYSKAKEAYRSALKLDPGDKALRARIAAFK